jgi:hypothetical protein
VTAPDRIVIEARSDAEDRLISADEPLAALQIRCGGKIPGMIAVPELLGLVTKSRSFGLRLARPIVAQDGRDAIHAWIEVSPADKGCHIVLRNWQARSLPAEASDIAGLRRMEIDRALAELTAMLDARQAVLAVESSAADLVGLAGKMRAGLGRVWTDFIELPGISQRQPLHWRLLDGARVNLPGSGREWRVTLAPQYGPAGAIVGFELCLTSAVPLPHAALPAPVAEPEPGFDGAVIGRELAPILRQPIARIIANAETIRTRRMGPLSEDYATYAGDIAAAGRHLQGLIEDLADMEAVERDSFAPAKDHIDLGDVARRAAGILGQRAREKGIELVVPGEHEKAPAVGEFRRVLQILLNLLGNAIRYSPENSTIWLLVGEGAGRALVGVADQGPGLAAQDLARVFDKFERLGRSGDGGTGLGLYISRRLARAMGGDLVVESEPGAGARFVLDLPAA